MIVPMVDPLKVVSYTAPAFIAAATIPVVWRFAKNIRRAKAIKNDDLYEDEDGKATEESMASYSTKKAFTVIFVGLGLGLAASFALIVDSFVQILEFNNPVLIWLLFGCWVCSMHPVFENMYSQNLDSCTHTSVGCLPRDPHCIAISKRRAHFGLLHSTCSP
jgi:hypothetical protein